MQSDDRAEVAAGRSVEEHVADVGHEAVAQHDNAKTNTEAAGAPADARVSDMNNESEAQKFHSSSDPQLNGSGDAATAEQSPKQSVPTLKLKIGAPPEHGHDQNHSHDHTRAFSLRRSERLRNQALRAEETRRIREERAAIEEARTKARSIAAKKAAATKRKMAKQAAKQKLAEENGVKIEPRSNLAVIAKSGSSALSASKVGKHAPKHIVKLHYFNPAIPPTFRPINLEQCNVPVSLFWLRLNLREFLYRFDKLCRLPTRFTSGLNDPLESWTPEQLKAIIVALLKLIANDTKPLMPRVRDYIAEIEALDASNPRIWDWLLDFIEQLDAFAPEGVPTTEEEQLELLRRLFVICTGTETIRITVMTDVDQLKWVEKDAQEDIKGIWAKYKETEQRLAKLKATDKEAYNDKLAAAHRSASNKAWKVQQQLYMKIHKYNMRTVPLLEDPHGNKYWSLQYKSPTQPSWGSWIICEMVVRPTELAAWYQKLSSDVTSVLRKRDLMIEEKNKERRKQRKEEKRLKTEDKHKDTKSLSEDGSHKMDVDSGPNTEMPSNSKDNDTTDKDVKLEGKSGTTEAREPNPESKTHPPKRRYPKLKITYPSKLPEPELYAVEGRENILQLAKWIAGFTGVDKKAVAEIESVATYLAQDD